MSRMTGSDGEFHTSEVSLNVFGAPLVPCGGWNGFRQAGPASGRTPPPLEERVGPVLEVVFSPHSWHCEGELRAPLGPSYETAEVPLFSLGNCE